MRTGCKSVAAWLDEVVNKSTAPGSRLVTAVAEDGNRRAKLS